MIEKKSVENSKWLIFVLGCLTAFGPLSIDVYLPAFLDMSQDLGVHVSEIQYTLTSFFAGLSIGQLIYGPISDRFGRRKPLLFGIVLFVITSFLIGFTKNLDNLVLLRFIQALGSCVGMVLTRAIIRDSFDFKDVAKVFSLILLVMGVAPIVAPMLGSQMLSFFNWRGIFFFLCAFGVVAFFTTFKSVRESLIESVPIRVSFSNYINLFSDSQFLFSSILSGTILAGMFSYISSSSIVFMDIFGLSKNIYPLLFGLNAFGFIMMAQVNVKLLNRFSIDKVLSIGIHLFLFNACLLGLVSYFNLGVFWFEVVLFFLVSSIGIVMPNISAKALEHQKHRAGVASALMGSLQFLIASGGTILVAQFSDLGVWSMVLALEIFVFLSYFLFRVLMLSSKVTEA